MGVGRCLLQRTPPHRHPDLKLRSKNRSRRFKSGYIVSHAKRDDRHFVKLTGYFNVDRIELALDEKRTIDCWRSSA